jgi:hypothetical protein
MLSSGDLLASFRGLTRNESLVDLYLKNKMPKRSWIFE